MLTSVVVVWFMLKLYRKGNPISRLGIIYFSIQFLQVYITIPFINFGEYSINESPDKETWELCFYSSSVQLIIMSLVLFRLTRKLEVDLTEIRIRNELEKTNVIRLSVVTFLISISYSLLKAFFGANASLMQLIMVGNGFMQMAVLFIVSLFLIFNLGNKMQRYFAFGYLLVNFILSFFSYFSSFKIYLVVIPVVVAMFGETFLFKNRFLLLVFSALTFISLVFWSSIKGDYRKLLSGGIRSQTVVVDQSTSLNYIKTKALNFSKKNFDTGLNALLYRVQYLEIYSRVVKKVPKKLPHENGNNILGSLEFLFVPRVFSPDKRILDPSRKVNIYTDKQVATAKIGTSISMGYFADLYIDFGFWLMTPFLLIIAAMIGLGMRYLVKQYAFSPLLTLAFCGAFIFNLGNFESDIDFYLGSIRNLFALLVLMHLTIPKKTWDKLLV